ncbi:endonuclease III [Candidatus Dependentiae bacterium]|nr:endonuclease III [Candidatus Dependentiae bacterium]
MQTTKQQIKTVIATLRHETKQYPPPLIDIIIQEYGKMPFLILISCLLSLRAKDVVTIHVCRTLFKKAQTPQELLAIPRAKLEKIIFKSGFYKNKSKVLHEVSTTIHEKYGDTVPRSLDRLLKIRGVGRKTANLVLGLAYNIPAICVDTHVHRISNRLGLVATRTPEATERALEKILPKKHWIEWNTLLVIWGQNKCTPRAPKCAWCAVHRFCEYGRARQP